MASTNPTTKHKPEKTNVGEQVLDLVIPYIHNLDDRNSVSLVSRKLCEIVDITRKRVTVHILYSNPSRLSKRFSFIESLTLIGPPFSFNVTYKYGVQITPWIEQLALKFRCLTELHIHGLFVRDKDLETLARTRGKDLRSLRIKKCLGFSTDGLRHVSNYCNELRTLSLGYSCYIHVKDGIWVHQLALNNKVLEIFKFKNTNISYGEDITLLANKCCNSLISLKTGVCCLSKLGDAFRYNHMLEHFGADIRDKESEPVGFQFPPNTRSLSLASLPVTRHSIVLPFVNLIRKLKPAFLDFNECECLLFKRCPNLEVLSTKDVCGDKGLQVIGKFCKKLRKLTHDMFVTHVGLIALAKGCTKLEYLNVRLRDILNDALTCLGTHLKNLREFRMHLSTEDRTTYPPLDNGIVDVLMGCRNLERLHISLSLRCRHQGLTDVGLEYIGKYGANLRSLSLTRMGNSDAGLVKLSEGCPNLRRLKLKNCPFSNQAVTSFVFNMPYLRYVYVWHESYDHTNLPLIRPEFQL